MLTITALLLFAQVPATPPPAPRIVVTNRLFLVEPAGGAPYPATEVPNVVGVCYRWVLGVKPREATAEIEERFTLPAAPDRWGGVEVEPTGETRLTSDRRVAVTPLTLSLADGLLNHGWCIAAGDPPGPYSIELFSAGRLLHRFDFTVSSPPMI